MQPSRIAQFILNSSLEPSTGSIVARLRRRLFRKARVLLIKLSDPLVRYKLANTDILIPLSHDLPFHISTFPYHLHNLGRVANHIHLKYPNLRLIDIGANVGDTVAIVRQSTHIPILCIEGNIRFAELLRSNTASISDVYVEPVFIGDPHDASMGSFRQERGTTYFVPHKKILKSVKFERLSKVLDSNPTFAGSKMIKIDTDGMDCAIIFSELALLETMKPAIFFEYDPYYFHRLGTIGFNVFQELASIGYGFAVIYDNTGDYLLSTELSNTGILRDVHTYFSGRYGMRYCDICVFHQEDEDLVRKLQVEERSHAHRTRGVGESSLREPLNA